MLTLAFTLALTIGAATGTLFNADDYKQFMCMVRSRAKSSGRPLVDLANWAGGGSSAKPDGQTNTTGPLTRSRK